MEPSQAAYDRWMGRMRMRKMKKLRRMNMSEEDEVGGEEDEEEDANICKSRESPG